MQKIPFNDRFLLTQGVLKGWKRKTRRVITIQPPYKNLYMGFNTGWGYKDNPEKDALKGAICWINKDNPAERTDWIKPKYKVGEVVAVSQSYKDAGYICHYYGDTDEFMYIIKDGSEKVIAPIAVTNKMFVKAELMPHQIRITDVFAQRLQDISDEDCLAEGIIKNETRYCFKEKVKQTTGDVLTFSVNFDTPREAYAALIDKISGKGTWDSNPWVWAYTFELLQ